MVNLDTPLGEQLLDVAIRQAKAQVPAHRQDNDLGWEPEADDGRPRDWSGTRATSSHCGSLAVRRRSPRTQRCPDLYLVTAPEPDHAGQERAYPAREPADADALLAKVLERDGAKRLAVDESAPLSAQALRRLPTRALRELRDQLAEQRAGCPPDRSREYQRAAEQALADEQAHRDAEAARRDALQEADGAGGLLALRAGRQTPIRTAEAQTVLQQAAQRAERSAAQADKLRRAEQERRAWLEAHDAPLRTQERAVTQELAWRRRADAAALAADPPTWLVALLGPEPEQREDRAAWREAAATLDGYRRLWGLSEPRPAQRWWGERDRAADGQGAGGARRGRPAASLLGPEPRGPGEQARRRDWQAARAALERLQERARQQSQDRATAGLAANATPAASG